MPYYFDDFETLRIGAGIRLAKLAREAELSRDTLDRIKKHKGVTQETAVCAVNALKKLHYGETLDHSKLITTNSRFGGNL